MQGSGRSLVGECSLCGDSTFLNTFDIDYIVNHAQPLDLEANFLHQVSDIHPLCVDCGFAMISRYQTKLLESNDILDIQKKAFLSLKHEIMAITPSLEEEIKQLQLQEAQVLKKALLISTEEKEVYLKLQHQKVEECCFQALETRIMSLIPWSEEIQVQTCLHSLSRAYNDLIELQRPQDLSTIFKINPKTHSINECKLVAPKMNVAEWEESNSAWGYLASLLVFLSKHYEFKCSKYLIEPAGSSSSVQELFGGAVYPLYTSYSVPKALRKQYDRAMVIYMQIVRELLSFVFFSTARNHVVIPHWIQGDLIGGQSIKRIDNKKKWDLALFNLLENLQFLLNDIQKRSPTIP